MIPVSNCKDQDVLQSIPLRMSGGDHDEPFEDEADLIPRKCSTEAQLAGLRSALREQSRRLRAVEKKLRMQETLDSVGILSPRPDREDTPTTANVRPEVTATPGKPSPGGKKDPGLMRPGQRWSEDDPYSKMWSSAKINSKARIFDQDLLRSIYDKPYRGVRHQAALLSSGAFGILSMPFGPIGMVLGAFLGAVLGAFIGLLVDARTARTKLQESELEKKRLRCLIRWASERHSSEDEDILKLIEMVTLEFKPIAEVAEVSKNARKVLRLLDRWIAKKNVTRKLWVYMDDLLVRWRDLSRSELLRSMLVLQTLTTMYRYSSRVKDEQEIQFLKRMERLLAHESVKSVLAHIQNNPVDTDHRVMQSMVYADAMETPPIKLFQSPPAVREPVVCAPVDPEKAVVSDDDSEVGVPPCEPGGASSPTGSHPTPIELAPVVPTEPAATTGTSSSSRKRVPKKPFFRNWEDFMDFDDTVKHKMPITLSEFQLLLQKEAETTQGWDVCVDRKDIKVAKVMYGPGLICLRAWTTFPGVDMHTAFHLFYDLEERTKWDKTFSKCGVIGSDIQGCDVVYCLMKIPTVTARDFLQYRRVRLNEDGSIAIVLRSAEHPDLPEDSRYIRVENKISGYVFRQEMIDSQPVLRLFLMSCSDVKGMIPKWIVNYLAPKKPGEWTESLRKAVVDYQNANPGCKEEVIKNVFPKFTQENPFDFEQEEPAGCNQAQGEAEVSLSVTPTERPDGGKGEVANA